MIINMAAGKTFSQIPVYYDSRNFFMEGNCFQAAYIAATHDHPWMIHDFFAIAYIIDGSGSYKTSKRNQAIKKGDVYFLNAGEPHRWVLKSELKNYTLYFKKSFFQELCAELPCKQFLRESHLADFAEGTTGGSFFLSLIAGESLEIKAIFQSILSEFEEQGDYYETRIKSLFTDLLILLHRINARKAKSIDPKHAREMQAVNSALEYIKANYARDVNIKEMPVAPFRHEYFSRLFRKHTGYRLLGYLNEMRILKACELLAHTDKKIIAVALDVGYQNITFFNRMFKKIMGIAPHSYRLSKMKIQKVS